MSDAPAYGGLHQEPNIFLNTVGTGWDILMPTDMLCSRLLFLSAVFEGEHMGHAWRPEWLAGTAGQLVT